MFRFIPLLIVAAAAASVRGDEIDFNRDLRPLLAAKCFACHGPDEDAREADLRLDLRQQALESGVIVPGQPDKSELVQRIESQDPEQRMPPPDSEQSLTDAERMLLRRWIASGAAYPEHWAFVPPQRPRLPEVRDRDWPRNQLDAFVLARIEAAGLSPSKPADRITLVRRVYLDLIGLPPTPEEADRFVADPRADAYERLVDRLLQSPRYGERWARPWLDLARYADTNGYEKDRPRSIWPYRDWVIQTLNADLPFDQFSIEQLAGDLLPAASRDQRVATGFHRNTMLNEEGGIDPLEYRYLAMVDRVATTGTVWLGLSTGCAQCHSHKYDPISHTDYYRLMGLMNNADEPDLVIRDDGVAAVRKKIEAQIEQAERRLPDQFPPDAKPGDEKPGDGAARRRRHLETRFEQWLADQRPRAVDWFPLRPTKLSTNLPQLEVLDDGSIFSSGDITKRDEFRIELRANDADGDDQPITALRLEVLPDERLPAGGPGRAFYEGRKGDFFLSELSVAVDGRPRPLAAASHSYGKISIGNGTADAKNVFDGEGSTGWSTAGREGESHRLVLNLAQPIDGDATLEVTMLFERHFAASLGRFRFWATRRSDAKASAWPIEVQTLLSRDPRLWTAAQRQTVLRQFLRQAPELAAARKEIDRLRQQLPDWPTTMVLKERPADNPRPTHRHHRGEYLSPRETVAPALPSMFQEADGAAEHRVANRLQFAKWLVSDRNPLVARVTVDRAWRALLGQGLVRSGGDFGTQSEPPTHPELLDWLAREFVEQRWSQKALHRTIVTSATYRQGSRAPTTSWSRDPDNRLLARGPRFRVDAETVRDIMLQASGQLSAVMYGPSVYPPQPASVTALAYGATRWEAATGDDRYRRSLYTFAKRTAPFAGYTVFDGPTGEACIARRTRSNTPLQALTLLNDAMYVELARHLATEAMQAQSEPEARASLIFRRLLTRPPEDQQRKALVDYYESQLARLRDGQLDASRIAGPKNASPELAAWTMVARVVMNLDETITKP